MSSGWLFNDFEDEEGVASPTPEKLTPKKKPQKPLLGTDAENPLSVSQLNQWIKRALEAQIPSIWIEAELTDLSKPSSGHFYMTLKDAEAQIRGVMWRSTAARIPFQLKDGLTVLCFGNLDVYGPRGTYQFIVQKMQPVGIGPLQLAFQQLHAKLQAEGLFNADLKKRLPQFPRRIAFVTSPSGAAVHDFLEVLRRRWKGVHVTIIPVKVQGEGAAQEIAAGIRAAAKVRPKFDVVVVGRGGGSIEDLWSFNEEAVVRAVAACPIPTVSAVGHEIDVTLCDLAADIRALTPTEAAERILPNSDDLLDWLATYHQRATSCALQKWQMLERRLEAVASRPVLASPEELLHRRAQRLDEIQLRLEQGVASQIALSKQRLAKAVVSIEALSPLAVLRRGYSVTRQVDSREVISSIDQIEIGSTIETLLDKGSVISRVERKQPSL